MQANSGKTVMRLPFDSNDGSRYLITIDLPNIVCRREEDSVGYVYFDLSEVKSDRDYLKPLLTQDVLAFIKRVCRLIVLT